MFADDFVTIHHGDCLEVMPTLPADSIDAIVTDPPYGLSFMGRDWDHGVPGEHFWAEALRVAKPGAHLLAFGGTRTFHRLACAIEDSGWEIRDTLGWIYGSGFPKSLNIGNGYGTALKPAYEPIILARKPLSSTVAANVQQWGTGALNIDASRIPTDEDFGRGGERERTRGYVGIKSDETIPALPASPLGRWPANIIHDGSEEVLSVFPQTSSNSGTPFRRNATNEGRTAYGDYSRPADEDGYYGDSGSAARFFYCAKAAKSERGEGNTHPTVKPLKLMRYLVRLITPPGGTVLDPFAGSGTTLLAAEQEGFDSIGIEMEAEHITIIEGRLVVVEGMLF